MEKTTIIEDYLLRSDLAFDTIEEALWIVHDDLDHVDNIVIQLSEPLVVFRVKLMDLPADTNDQTQLFRKLLELNATEMVSGAYGIEGDSIIATETLQSENLDYNEFRAAIDGITLSIMEHYEALRSYHHTSGTDASQDN